MGEPVDLRPQPPGRRSAAVTVVAARARIAGNTAAMRDRLRSRRDRRPSAHSRGAWVVTGAVLAGMIAVLTAAAAITLDPVSLAWARSLPAWIQGTAQVLTDIGRSNWILIPTGVLAVALLLADWTVVERRIAAAWAEIGALSMYLFLAVAGSGVLVNLLKQIVGRGRPVVFAEFGPFSFHAFSFNYANESFPSGHATTLGALAAALVLIVPRRWIVIVLFALVAAATRVVVGAHYPSDVVAGMAVGAACAAGLAALLARFHYAFRRGAGLRPLPRLTAVKSLVRGRRWRRLATGLGAALIGRPAEPRSD